MKAFVLGHPIEHSLSPALHIAAYQALGFDALDISYEKIDTLPEQFADRMAMGDADPLVKGFSVTMPLKKEACASVEVVSDFARTLGVANTVYWRFDSSGRRISYGHNTDVSGIVNALIFAGLKKAGNGRFAVLGGGGTAISAVVAGKVLGFDSVEVFARNVNRAEDVVDLARQLGMQTLVKSLADFPEEAGEFEAVISTLPAGSADDWASEIKHLQKGVALLDVSYDPWPSVLAQQWESLGGSVVSGLEMLLYQAFEQVKLFSGHSVSYRFANELEVLNAMAEGIGLSRRDSLPTPVEVLNS